MVLSVTVLGMLISGWMTRHFITLFVLLVLCGCGITPEHTGGVGWSQSDPEQFRFVAGPGVGLRIEGNNLIIWRIPEEDL